MSKSKLNLTQKIVKIVGEKDKYGGNTWFNSDITDPDNQSVYVETDTTKALGSTDKLDISRVAKARIKRLLNNG